MPRVLNYKTHGCPDNAVYIGRPVPSKRIRESKWANPYPLRRNASPEQCVEVIAKYELYLYDSGLIKDVHELHGNDLVCWCAPEALSRRRAAEARQCRGASGERR